MFLSHFSLSVLLNMIKDMTLGTLTFVPVISFLITDLKIESNQNYSSFYMSDLIVCLGFFSPKLSNIFIISSFTLKHDTYLMQPQTSGRHCIDTLAVRQL